MPISILVGLGIATAGAVVGGVTSGIVGNNKLNKERVAHQEERDRLQRQIEDLLEKIAQKDAIILNLSRKIKDLDEEKKLETQKRYELLKMVDQLEKRQAALESLLKGFLAFVTFRLGKWKSDKIELRKSLEQANNDVSLVDNLLEKIEKDRKMFEIQMDDETSQRDQMAEDRKRLSKEFEMYGCA